MIEQSDTSEERESWHPQGRHRPSRFAGRRPPGRSGPARRLLPRRLPARWLSVRRGTGLIVAGCMIAGVGLVGLAAVANLIWGTADDIRAEQRTLAEQFEHASVPPGTGAVARRELRATVRPPKLRPPAPGRPVALVDIPRIDERWVVVEGVAPQYIEHAPGHYPRSAMPGEIGNFAVAGHRVKGMFWDLDRLRRGDPIVVRAGGYWYVYAVTITRVVRPTAVEVVAPVPGRPGAKPTVASLTLTTCEPKWGNSHRLIVHAALVRVQPRDGGTPAELRG